MDAAVDEEPLNLEERQSRLKSGDRQALADLFAHYRPRLWQMVHFRMDRRLLGRIDPDDVLQEAYLAAASRLGSYGAEATVSAFVWLRLIVLQTLVDLHRHHVGAQMRDAGREVALPAPRYPQSTSVALAAQIAGQFTSPSQAAARAEMFRHVEQAIEGMDPFDREVLALRHFEELDNHEVAEVLGIQQKAASIRYVRALRRLKAILGNTSQTGEGGQHVGVR